MNFPNSDILSDGFDEALYLSENPDVAEAVRLGHFDSGLAHFLKYGHRENRSGGPDPVNPPALRFPAPLPPRELRKRVHGAVQVGSFELVGNNVAEVVVSEANLWLPSLSRPLEILDFGCGCARVLAYIGKLADVRAWGADIDEQAISWCQQNLQDVATFCRNSPLPPLQFPDNAFDLVYSISVMTHLPEKMQLAWLQELRRVTRPGGVLLLTVRDIHDVPLRWHQRLRYWRRGFIHCGGLETPGLPEFYRSAFHSERYVTRRWSEFFEILAFKRRAINGDQDLIVCRKSDQFAVR